MTRTRINAILAPVVAAALLTATSCDNKELCYDHPHTVPARISVDWSRFTQEQPTGMTVTLYSATDPSAVYSTPTNNTAYADLNVLPDTYTAMVYNQSPDEFGTLTFSDLGNAMAATVNAAPKVSRWYKTRTDDERVVQNPEWIASDCRSGIVAPEEAVASRAADGTRSIIATLTPRCDVYTIHINIHINNIYNLRSARATLDGLADGYRLTLQQPTATTATQLIEEWSLTHDADNPSNGTLHATITSFGLPQGHTAAPAANTLRLSMLLVDNKTQVDHEFAVGDRFHGDDGTELTLSIDESIDTPLPDVKPEGGSSGGFDATVDDWEEQEEIDITV